MAITWNYLSQSSWGTTCPTDNNFYKRGGTCFLPRFTFLPLSKGGAFEELLGHKNTPKGFERIDNITDTARQLFQTHYSDDNIDKNAIFFYVYGILHHPK